MQQQRPRTEKTKSPQCGCVSTPRPLPSAYRTSYGRKRLCRFKRVICSLHIHAVRVHRRRNQDFFTTNRLQSDQTFFGSKRHHIHGLHREECVASLVPTFLRPYTCCSPVITGGENRTLLWGWCYTRALICARHNNQSESVSSTPSTFATLDPEIMYNVPSVHPNGRFERHINAVTMQQEDKRLRSGDSSLDWSECESLCIF